MNKLSETTKIVVGRFDHELGTNYLRLGENLQPHDFNTMRELALANGLRDLSHELSIRYAMVKLNIQPRGES